MGDKTQEAGSLHSIDVGDQAAIDAWLRRALEHTDLFVVVLDARGRVLSCNEHFSAVTGWAREDLIGRDLRAIVESVGGRGSDSPRSRKPESELVTRKGERRLVRWHETLIPDLDGAVVATVRLGEDVTEQQRMQEAVRRAEARYRAFIAQSSEGIWRFELDPPVSTALSEDDQVDAILTSGRVVECNDAMARMHGLESAEDLAGARLSKLFEKNDARNIALYRAFVRARYRLDEAESFTESPDGGARCLVHAMTGTVESGRLVRAWGVQRDETERHEIAEELRRANQDLERRIRERTRELEMVNEQLLEQATRDGLTGLANRRHFNTVLGLELRRARRDGSFLSLLLCDVDFFKRYNDRYGHLAGDQCLVAVATALTRNFRRATDLCARFGGEEFAVILSGCGPEDAARLAERLRASVENEHVPHGDSSVSAYLTISVGAASARVGAETTMDFIVERADRALYASKEGGRNKVNLISGADPTAVPGARSTPLGRNR